MKCGGPIYNADDGWIDGTGIHVEVIRYLRVWKQSPYIRMCKYDKGNVPTPPTIDGQIRQMWDGT